MAEEPRPSTIPPSGADAANTAASAMNSISSDSTAPAPESTTTKDAGSSSISKTNTNLGEALSNLSVSEGASNGASGTANGEGKKKDEVKKVVKIEAADVAFLVSCVTAGTREKKGLGGWANS